MSNNTQDTKIQGTVMSGWLMLGILGMFLAAELSYVFMNLYQVTQVESYRGSYIQRESLNGLVIIIGSICTIFGLFMMGGFAILQPNESRVYTLFGKYAGTLSENGFWWLNPLLSERKISVKQNNLVTQQLKVNDKAGNPIEVSAVVVWNVISPAAALLNIENYTEYLQVQCESALRNVVAKFAYDHADEGEKTLLAAVDEVADELCKELNEQMLVAGIKIHAARISHLAYAAEIAQAMLRRQQAEAVIGARKLIVEGAVKIVQETISNLKASNTATLSEENQAKLVSNLLVVLVSENGAQPTVSVGS